MFDGDTHGVAISITTDAGETVTIVLPRHIATRLALEIKRAAEQ